MKKLIGMILLASASLLCADMWVWDVIDSNVSTNGTAASTDITTSPPLKGHLDSISLKVTSVLQPSTCTVVIATSSSYGCGVARTLFSGTVTTNTFYSIKIQNKGTDGNAISGAYGKIPLYDDAVQFKAYNRTTGSNIAIRCVLYYSDTP